MDGLSVEIDSVPYVHTDRDGTESLHLMVEDAHCAACIRRIEDGLRRHDGVVEARLNLTTRRLVVRWRDTGVCTSAPNFNDASTI